MLIPLAARSPWYAPILNITASKALIRDHNQIYDPRFVSFVRELYMDTLRQEFDQLRR